MSTVRIATLFALSVLSAGLLIAPAYSADSSASVHRVDATTLSVVAASTDDFIWGP